MLTVFTSSLSLDRLTVFIHMLIILYMPTFFLNMVTVYIYSHYFCLASSPLLSPPTTSTPYLTLCLAAAAHCFHLCLLLLFGRLSPLLSSPLLSSLLPMMKVSKSRTYLEYKLMIMNL